MRLPRLRIADLLCLIVVLLALNFLSTLFLHHPNDDNLGEQHPLRRRTAAPTISTPPTPPPPPPKPVWHEPDPEELRAAAIRAALNRAKLGAINRTSSHFRVMSPPPPLSPPPPRPSSRKFDKAKRLLEFRRLKAAASPPPPRRRCTSDTETFPKTLGGRAADCEELRQS